MSDEDRMAGSIAATGQAERLAEFVERISGGLVSNGLGLIADRLAYFRLVQALRLQDKVNAELERRGVKEPCCISPKLLVPLLQGATVEEDEGIHDRYSMLLANARDPDYKGKITRSFVSILDDLEPIDVLILDVCHDSAGKLYKHFLINLNRVVEYLKLPKDNVEISVRNLMRLGLLKPGVVVSRSVSFGNHPATSYMDIEQFALTELGVAFVAGTRPRQSDAASRSAA